MSRGAARVLALLLWFAAAPHATHAETRGYVVSLSEAWQPVAGQALRSFAAESGPVDAAFVLRDPADAPPTALLVRHERADIHPRTAHQWRVRIERESDAEVWLDPSGNGLHYAEPVDPADPAGGMRIHFVFFGRDRAVVLTCAGPPAALDTSCREAADGFAWEPGFETRDEFGRRVVTAGAVIAALAIAGVFFYRRDART